MSHTFQPYPKELLEINPFQKIKDAFVVCTEVNGKVNLMTASWGGIGVLWGKDVCTIYIRESRYTRHMLNNSSTFSCCFLNDQEVNTNGLMKYLGQVSGRDEDKLAGSRLNINHTDDGIAYVDESNLVFACRTMSVVPITEDTFIDPNINADWYQDGDYHYMYIAELTDVFAR